MIQTFLFVRLGEEELCKNVAWKLQKCCKGVEGGDGDRKPACTFFGKRIAKVYLVYCPNIDNLATNNMLGYDMPRAKLKIICTARFWIDSRW